MIVTIEQTGDTEIIAKFERAPAAYLNIVGQQMRRTVDLLQSGVKDKLDGGVLNRQSGRLYESIQNDITITDNVVIGRVFSTDPKAHIHEHGGITRPHEIIVKNARALRFIAGKIYFTQDDVAFAMKVNHPGSRIPMRSFMRSTLRESLAYIRDLFRPEVSKL